MGKSRWAAILLAAVLVAGCLGGCGSDPVDDSVNTGRAASTPDATTPAPEPYDEPTANPAPEVIASGSAASTGLPSDPQTAVPPAGASAAVVDAPRAADGLDYLDLSPAARQNFANWVAHEVWETTFSNGVNRDLTAGVSAVHLAQQGHDGRPGPGTRHVRERLRPRRSRRGAARRAGGPVPVTRPRLPHLLRQAGRPVRPAAQSVSI